MINSFSLQQIAKTGNFDSNLMNRQYNLNSMAGFMQIKNKNSKLRQPEIADQLGETSSTLKRYENDLYMISPYRIHKNFTKKRSRRASNTNFGNNTHC